MNDENITLESALEAFSLNMCWVRNALAEATETGLTASTCANLMNTLEAYWDWLEETQAQAACMDSLGLGFSNKFLLKLHTEVRDTELVLMSGVHRD